MRAVRLHGPCNLRLDDIPEPERPGPGEVMIGVRAVGICGSDLHTYRNARIGDTAVPFPLIPGHEFSGIVDDAGELPTDANGKPLLPGTRVAVDPAQPCGKCEMCLRGHPNLCTQLHFCGLYPDNGALCERIRVPASTCFPLPDGLDAAAGAMLEPLGVALHSVNLARLHKGDSVSVHGGGPIGLLILQAARLAGAGPLFLSEPLSWRRELAERFGAVTLDPAAGDVPRAIAGKTGGRGVDVAFEAGWAGPLAQEAAETVRHGGTVMLVGIPEDDGFTLKHSTARRKGLTLIFVRRMKHTYPEAIRLVERGLVDVASLITHRFPLERTPEAFTLNDGYLDRVVKVIIDLRSRPS
jgi:L-iditol 2-dehydrogenase